MDWNGTSKGFSFFTDAYGNGRSSTLGSYTGNSIYDWLHSIEKGFGETTDGQDFTSAMGQLLELPIFSSRGDLQGKSEALLERLDPSSKRFVELCQTAMTND